MSKSIHSRLLAVQSALRAPKSQVNKFGGYKYRNCEDILEAVKPLLSENGLSLLLSDEVVIVGDRFYVRATARAICVESGAEITSSAMAREEENKKGMDQSQITGASSSYARKYALNGLFLIDDTRDSDSTNTHGKDETAPASKPMSQQTAQPAAKTESLKERYDKAVQFISGSKDKSTAVKQALDMIAKERIPFTPEQIQNITRLAEVVGADTISVKK